MEYLGKYKREVCTNMGASVLPPTVITVCLPTFIVIAADPATIKFWWKSLLANIHSVCISLYSLICSRAQSAHTREACYILHHAEMRGGGVKVLQWVKDTGRKKWKHWTCMQLDRVWSVGQRTSAWWSYLTQLICDFWPRTKDIADCHYCRVILLASLAASYHISLTTRADTWSLLIVHYDNRQDDYMCCLVWHDCAIEVG